MAKYFLSAVFFLAPFPLFFDLARFSFFIKFPKSVMELFLSRPLIPLPNALLALLLYQSIAILKIYKGSVDFQFIWTHNRPFYVGLLSLFFNHCIFYEYEYPQYTADGFAVDDSYLFCSSHKKRNGYFTNQILFIWNNRVCPTAFDFHIYNKRFFIL